MPASSAISNNESESRRNAAGSSSRHSTVWRGKKDDIALNLAAEMGAGKAGATAGLPLAGKALLRSTPWNGRSLRSAGHARRLVGLIRGAPHDGDERFFDLVEAERLGDHRLARHAP